MLDEILFRYDQLEFWFYMHRTEHWLYQLITQYPLSSGIVIGLVAGYYAEPTMDYLERISGRRAMRRRLRERKRQRERGKV